MISVAARTTASPDAVWPLLARPARWHEWAPHVRGAWGLGDPEVILGSTGAARLLGVVPVPATITAKVPGRSWSWRVGPVELAHRVEPRPGGGSAIVVELRGPRVLEAVMRATYGPVVGPMVRRLAHVAEAGAPGPA